MSAEPSSGSLTAWGERVGVSPATGEDIDDYRRAMEASARRIGVWNPVNPGDLVHHLGAQSEAHRTFLIRALQPRPGAPLVGCVNVSNVVRGRFMSATLGYNAFDPYAGQGLFREGLAMVMAIAMRQEPHGMGLHRLEANVQIGNATSAGLLRSIGFRRERTVRRMLWLADGLGGPSAWRDHDSYAITRDEWPAEPFAPQRMPRGVLVLGAMGSVGFLRALADELGAVTLVDVPFEIAGRICHSAAGPVIWAAGNRSGDAMRFLHQMGAPHASIDAEVMGCIRGENSGQNVTARAVARLALAVRPYLE